MTPVIRSAVVGAGRWGLNHVRAFSRAKEGVLVAVCDPLEAARLRARELAPDARLEASFQAVLAAPDVDAIVLATPAKHHAEMACAALQAGKHVLVEKPLAMRTADAEAVVAAAARAGRTLMVGHLMLYHPAVERMREAIAADEIGRTHYVYSLRVNLGTLRQDEDALWSLAPHDISIILHLLGEPPASVSARGGSYLQPGVADVVFLNLRFPSGVLAQIQVSWLNPRKERRVVVVGSKKMLEFDDTSAHKLTIHDKGYDREPAFVEYAEYLSIRNGEVQIAPLTMAEPLERECRHFLECCASGRTPITDGRSALEVVRVLEAAQRSLAQDGASISLS